MWLTSLLTIWASVCLFGAWVPGILWLAIVPARIAAVPGWLTAEWGRGRPWTALVWTVLSASGLV